MRRNLIGLWQAEACPGELRSPGKLKHAPPMRRSHLEMAKLQWQTEAYPATASRGFEALGDFLLRNRAALDDAPIGLGDIDGGGALAGAAAAIEDQNERASCTERVQILVGADS